MVDFASDSSPLRDALRRGLQPGGNLAQELGALDLQITDPDDAEAVVGALARIDWRSGPPLESLQALAWLFQDAASEEVVEVLGEAGMRELTRSFDRLWPQRHAADDELQRLLLFLLKLFAMYDWAPGVDRLLAALAENYQTDDFLWSVILQVFPEGSPERLRVFEALEGRLPSGFAAVALLDSANQACLSGESQRHVFNTPGGHHQLEGWLLDSDPQKSSYAHSACAALAFVDRPIRDRLLPVALDHADRNVQLEAAYVSARLGSEAGLRCLVRYALEVHSSRVACSFLEELQQADRIPDEARQPDFLALAEMSHWLQHPSEYGRVPDEIEVLDRRWLAWPPTSDRRELWLIHYSYHREDEHEAPDEGVGLVGSVTFALFGDTHPRMPPEDIYALHCCWELQCNRDPRAPAERTVLAGRQLLAEAEQTYD